MKKRMLCLALLFLAAILMQNANACGCGIAISDMKVFNALKETQAYLMIDVKDKTTYDEMPFFRFISMDKPYDVTIVFPIDQVPYDVEGKKISAREFLHQYGVNDAEYAAKKQNISEFKDKIKGPLFIASNGFFGIASQIFTSVGAMGAMKSATEQGISPIAHFEFEGGSLDIYNVSSMKTLEEFVKTVNITLTDKVKELVTKYNNYYVAVLYLKVPSVIDEKQIEMLQRCMPEGLERIKDRLTNTTEISMMDIESMMGQESRGSACGPEARDILREYISRATYASKDVNGTLVIMKFKDNDNFFYPTSIVDSYKYPITDQKYYIRVPKDLHVELSSSDISNTISLDSERWYNIKSTKEDLKGKIVEAGMYVKIQDSLRYVLSFLNNNLGWVILAFYILMLVIPLILLKKKEGLTLKEMSLALAMYLLGGLLLSSIIMFFKKKRILSLMFLAIWLILLMIYYI